MRPMLVAKQISPFKLRAEHYQGVCSMAGPRFAPDLSKAQAGMLVLDRGEYEFKCGGPKPFFYVKDDGTEVAGVRVPVELVGQIGADGSAEPYSRRRCLQECPVAIGY